MKKALLGLALSMLLFVPIGTFAQEEINDEDFQVVATAEKYYKTTCDTRLRYISDRGETIEITKEEYDAVQVTPFQTRGAGTTETTYKRLVTTIAQSNSFYEYETTLTWKNFPAVRSYDVIGIGHYSSVQYIAMLNFEQNYCTAADGCRTLTTSYNNVTDTGCGAAFKVPNANFTSLNQKLSFYVEKVTAATVTSQAAYGDYSHAVETVTSSEAQQYYVGPGGIVFDSQVSGSYDNIQPATATWSGTWN